MFIYDVSRDPGHGALPSGVDCAPNQPARE
jgi:hypothetical protein